MDRELKTKPSVEQTERRPEKEMGCGVLLRGFALLGGPGERGGRAGLQMLVPGTVGAVQPPRTPGGSFWDEAV